MKFALVSSVLPPSDTGQAMILHRLLSDLPGDAYCLISHRDYRSDGYRGVYTKRLPASYHFTPVVNWIRRGSGYRITRLAQRWITLPYGIRRRGRQIARIVREQRCHAIVACSGGDDLLDLPAARYASRLTGVPFYPYYFDYYALQWFGTNAWHPSIGRRVARKLESNLMRDAVAVIVPNEFMADELERRYHVRTVLVRNALDLEAYGPSPDPPRPAPSPGNEIRIVYTGAIYYAHYDSFRTLLAAIALQPAWNIKLHLYTSHTPEELAGYGISGPIIFHPHEAAAAMPGIQRSADILFLPLAFNSPYPELIRTSAPGKSAEYLASGRPILVHTPADSWPSWYFRKHECGVVSDQQDPGALASTIESILRQPDLRHRLAINAAVRVREDFDLGVARAAFGQLLELRPRAIPHLPPPDGAEPFLEPSRTSDAPARNP